MTRYKTRDGASFKGANPMTAAQALRRLSHTPEGELAEWIEITAEAATMQTGRQVRADDAATFLADLERAGLIERISDHAESHSDERSNENAGA